MWICWRLLLIFQTTSIAIKMLLPFMGRFCAFQQTFPMNLWFKASFSSLLFHKADKCIVNRDGFVFNRPLRMDILTIHWHILPKTVLKGLCEWNHALLLFSHFSSFPLSLVSFLSLSLSLFSVFIFSLTLSHSALFLSSMSDCFPNAISGRIPGEMARATTIKVVWMNC